MYGTPHEAVSIPPLRVHEDAFEHFHVSEDVHDRISRFIKEQDTLQLTTVGIDIGSSTTHLLFAKITLQRETQSLSSRFVVVEREILWRSPIRFTPFTGTGLIDAHALGHFFEDCYREAGFARDDVDSGAVILTGEAIKQQNARAIDHLFAGEAGKFVCATAGHQLEATLAAYGSGAVALSSARDACLLHVDIGGGTTKLALIDRGRVASVAAFAVGGRLLARNGTGSWDRVDDSARLAADALGIALDELQEARARDAVARRLAGVLLDYVGDAPRDALGKSLLLTEELVREKKPQAITFSGGVAEYLFGREQADFGDIAGTLAEAIRDGLPGISLPVLDPGNGIRATVIGASQFTVQVSGKTNFLSDPAVLPLRNVPVVRVELPEALEAGAVEDAIRAALARTDLSAHALLALAFEWRRDPAFANLLPLCAGIERTFRNGRAGKHPLIVMVDGDIALNLGHLLHDEIGLQGELIAIDGVTLSDLDFVDVGELMRPANVIPLVIKSLLFS